MDDRVKRAVAFIAGLFVALFASAQSFDVEQFDQVFRPRLRWDTRYQPPTSFRDTSGSFSNMEETAVLTFPIRSKFDVSAGVDLTAKSLGDLLKNAVRIKASQLLGSVRVGARQSEFTSLGGSRQLYTASAGLLGIGLTRKSRLRFWSANLNISEDERTFRSIVPRVNGLIGWVHLKGLKRYHYYGIAASYSDGLGFPLPFFGGMAPLSGDWSFQYLLPAQAAFAWRPDRGIRASAGVTLDGFRTGFERYDARVNMNYASLRLFGNVRYRINDHFTLRAEAGYVPWQNIHFTQDAKEIDRYRLQPGPSFMLGVNVLFGESILQRVMDEVLK